MSDKAPVQHELADRLSKLVLPLAPERALLLFQAFSRTMLREWTKIDQYVITVC